MTDSAPSRRTYLGRNMLMAIIFATLAGTLTASLLCLLIPPLCEATATIQVRSTKIGFLQTPHSIDHYDVFVNSQIELIRMPDVIDRALENLEVAGLPIVTNQRDKKGWLTRTLHIRRLDRSEIVTVSIATPYPEDSAKIVNAVVNSYFEHIENYSRAADQQMLSNLLTERRRHQLLADTLQENIRKSGEDASANQDGIAFDRRQLDRVDAVLDKIEDRIIAVTAEQRAPGQVVLLSQAISSAPSHKKRLIIGGTAGITVFCITLFLGVVIGCINALGRNRYP